MSQSELRFTRRHCSPFEIPPGLCPGAVRAEEDGHQVRVRRDVRWDEEVGVVFRKFKVFEPRTPQTETACVGENGQCPSFRIETIHPGDTDCTDRAYPKYQKPPI